MVSRVAKPKSFRLKEIVQRDKFQFNDDGEFYLLKTLNDFVTEDFAEERHLLADWHTIDERFRELDKISNGEGDAESDLSDEEMITQVQELIGQAKGALKALIRFRFYDDIPDEELDRLDIPDLTNTVDFLSEYRREQQVEARERRQEQQKETERTRQEAAQPLPNRSRGRKSTTRKKGRR